jgi:hypothetical protein
MSCKGIGGTSVTEPWLVQQTLEESSHKTVERELGYIPPRMSRKNQRKLNKAMNDFTVFKANKSKVPIGGTIGHYPKAKSNSSLQVQGLQMLTSVAGLPVGKKQRRRTRARQRKMANYGSIEGIPMGDAKLRVITMNNTGSWLAPKNDAQKQDFLRKANEFSISQEDIKGRPPIFYCGDDSGKIDGIPNNAIVRDVSSDLLVVCLNSHTDDDSFYGVVTDLDADPLKYPQMEDDNALYFTFPTLGLAIALRPGDILIFNPAVYHSVSSRRDPTKNIWCTSLYTKNAVVGGNDNSRAIETVQKEAIDMAKTMIQCPKKN